MSEKEQFRKIPKNLIDIPEWLPRKSENDKEDIDTMEGLSNSIKNTGLLNPITIKEKKNGRFDLIAGSRRLKAFGDDELWAKVEDKSIDEFDARIKCASENEQRLDLPFLERDDFYYKTFELGMKKGNITSIRDLAKLLGMNNSTLSKYICAGEERHINKNDIIITSSNTEALNLTKLLSNMPNVRNILLKMNIDNVLFNKDLQVVSKEIENCIKKGMTEKTVVQIIDMAKKTFSTIDNIDTKVTTYDFGKRKFEELVTTIIKCKPDVRSYIVDKKISLKEAEEISMFETEEQRGQLIQERIKVNKWAEKTSCAIEDEWSKNISIRKQQVVDIKTNDDTTLKTDYNTDNIIRIPIISKSDMVGENNGHAKPGIDYLISIGYKIDEIYVNSGTSPDLRTINDGKGWEVKNVYGNTIYFTVGQKNMNEDTNILIFDDDQKHIIVKFRDVLLGNCPYSYSFGNELRRSITIDEGTYSLLKSVQSIIRDKRKVDFDIKDIIHIVFSRSKKVVELINDSLESCK